ncbi:hypothetical protein ACIQTZ_12130 [Paenarthrobacter sp. NPDC090520]|uniref:hypothetical protein n=1 Tax=Paenarthrobacter sp. NPDC090520 TaxID=3364382 RepID=UPI0038002DD0
MGVLFDYFSAGSDEEAAAVIDRPGGPGYPAAIVPSVESRRGFFGLRRRSAERLTSSAPGPLVYETVSVKGIDPVVQLGALEELLTGRAYDDVVDDPRSGHTLATRDGDELLVVTLTDSLFQALACIDDDVIEQAAVPWSESEEFFDAADPRDLADFLKDLSALARRAEAAGHRLYCWASL